MIGNVTLKHTQSIVMMCLKYKVPVLMENPLTSLMWKEPVQEHLKSLPSCVEACTDYCQHGTRWRKSTRFCGWNCGRVPSVLEKRCSGRNGLCSSSGLGHITLQGNGPGGMKWTQIAEPYPKPVSRALAKWLLSSASSIEHARCASLIL